ncbi:VPS9 domain-containing protein 1 isoform X1 [Gadus chalcogrammus]|uniref:VPS9 domain-containing protein 1 isoform X1 n=1 Tax=Gadus chalcogrammus TaxID=1042646 RepID=UPI0024C4BB49|nr:VPS9 domain-containing protein 1 isoform X1 [Gadus chalcogrammus]
MAAFGSDTILKPLQNAMKMAKTAIQMDAENQHKEAYCEYLRSINYISHALLEDAGTKKGGELEAVEVERMFRLAEQCIERAKSFTGRSQQSHDLSSPSPLPPPPSILPHQTETPKALGASYPNSTEETPDTQYDPLIDVSPKATSPSNSPHHRELLEGAEEPPPFVPPEVFQRLQTAESQDTSRKALTPIEEASRVNQRLKAKYEARLARLAPGQACQKTSLSLSLQRQMMENLIIAQARQDALQRKMEERRLRLQEEANRRFAASGTTTAEEQEQRVIYANILEYEQDHDWPKQWKANLKKSPDDPTLVSGLVSYLLSCPDHPVMTLLRKHQYRVYNHLYPIISKGRLGSPQLHQEPQKNLNNKGFGLTRVTTERPCPDSALSPPRSFVVTLAETGEAKCPAMPLLVDRENSFEDLEQFLDQLEWEPSHDNSGLNAELTFDPSVQPLREESRELEVKALREHLKAIVKDIHISIDQLLSLCLLSFECLNTANSKDLCVASIEEAFFAPLWSPLLVLFRKVYKDREQAFECSMKRYRDASPEVVGVPLKLFPQDASGQQCSYPYQSAVQELKLLCNDCCPQRKLECIVRTLRNICVCAEDYRCHQEVDSPPKSAAIGADDLLPILSYVALRCDCPQLVSECAALEEFIHEGYLIGEEGYCLTSMQSALAYVESLHTGGALLCTAKLT